MQETFYKKPNSFRSANRICWIWTTVDRYRCSKSAATEIVDAMIADGRLVADTEASVMADVHEEVAAALMGQDDAAIVQQWAGNA